MKQKLPKVSIIILDWNGGKDIIECLKSIKGINYTNYELIVVDNASFDNSVNLIREKFPNIRIIQNKENLGFAGGMNTGIVQSVKCKVQSDYVLLLNQDTIVGKNFLKELVKVAESDPKIGIVGPKIYYWKESRSQGVKLSSYRAISNQLPITNYQLPNIIWSCGTKFATGSIFKMEVPYIAPVPIGCGKKDRSEKQEARGEKRELPNSQSSILNSDKEVDAITGCCMLIKFEVIDKIGLLDERFFIIHEDDDYCVRARKAGYKVCVAPKSIIWHKVSTSLLPTSYFPLPTSKSYEANPMTIYYGYRNWLIVLRKHFGSFFIRVFFTYIVKVFPLSFINLIRERKLSLRITLSYLYIILDTFLWRMPKRFLKLDKS
ncbi:glycosyltransferase family 2 protein [candidate division WOR-3 bacterium]|nr:glycosyltransferase family 2 protein [candidate division WOR-3 bacterium]